MTYMKKTCYLFIFDGFADHEVSAAAASIFNSNEYQLKTIAISKDPVKSMSGLTILPDTDFIPEVDLDDIDRDNTAMLILPGTNDGISPLIEHCLMLDIPVVSSSPSILEILETQVA
jgi:hypothetical protein